MFLVLFDFEFQLQKMVENWHAARIRSSLEILLSDTKLQTHGNVNDSASFPDFLLQAGDLYSHHLNSLLVSKNLQLIM